MRGKTIQVFLTDGTPRGIKIAEITSNIEQAIFIPRNKINEASSRKELAQPSVYFLFGEADDSSKPLAYIGQSRNSLNRIKSHDQKKDFWNYAVLIVSKTRSFTQTHIEFLEQLAISKAEEANRYTLENGVSPRQFEVPETLEADLLDNFDTIKILLSTLSFPLFEPLKTITTNKHLLFCKGRTAYANGEYQEDGFVVFKGSKANTKLTPTAGPSVRNRIERLISNGILTEENGVYIFQDDFLFSSPSAAASTVLARNANGWKEWKNKEGKTLDELERN
jgi:uncharacterized protein DUF4357